MMEYLKSLDSQTIGMFGFLAVGGYLFLSEPLKKAFSKFKFGSANKSAEPEMLALESTLAECLPEAIRTGKQSAWNSIYKIRLNQLEAVDESDTTEE